MIAYVDRIGTHIGYRYQLETGEKGFMAVTWKSLVYELQKKGVDEITEAPLFYPVRLTLVA